MDLSDEWKSQTAYGAYYPKVATTNYLRNRKYLSYEDIGICRTTCGEIGCSNSAIVEIRFKTQLRGEKHYNFKIMLKVLESNNGALDKFANAALQPSALSSIEGGKQTCPNVYCKYCSQKCGLYSVPDPTTSKPTTSELQILKSEDIEMFSPMIDMTEDVNIKIFNE